MAITGPSGCGKSTMLNMIGCMDMPTRGKVLLENRDISEFSSNNLARIRCKKIGFVFQTFNHYPTLTTIANIQLLMRIHEFPESDIEETSKNCYLLLDWLNVDLIFLLSYQADSSRE